MRLRRDATLRANVSLGLGVLADHRRRSDRGGCSDEGMVNQEGLIISSVQTGARIISDAVIYGEHDQMVAHGFRRSRSCRPRWRLEPRRPPRRCQGCDGTRWCVRPRARQHPMEGSRPPAEARSDTETVVDDHFSGIVLPRQAEATPIARMIGSNAIIRDPRERGYPRRRDRATCELIDERSRLSIVQIEPELEMG